MVSVIGGFRTLLRLAKAAAEASSRSVETVAGTGAILRMGWMLTRHPQMGTVKEPSGERRVYAREQL